MASLSNSSWRANAACMAGALFSHILVEPSMSVKRKVTVPEGGLATTTSMCSLLPSIGHYSSGAVSEPSVKRSVWKEGSSPRRSCSTSKGEQPPIHTQDTTEHRQPDAASRGGHTHRRGSLKRLARRLSAQGS